MAALLHDTVEDTKASLEDIEREFGPTVKHLVDGVSKISQMSFKNLHQEQGENIRKMIVAMGKDIRVIIVKLADRLHNMRTLNFMPYHKQLRIAQETLDIYSPLAGRLGIHSIKVELEELGFRYAHPNMYYQLVQKITQKKKERQSYIQKVIKLLTENLKKEVKFDLEITGRSKELYSIYKKMKAQNMNYEQVHDLTAFRVVVKKISQCYEVLGFVHSLWKPIPGRFKDFIAMPKANNYQSLHTTVLGPEGKNIEVQIRTEDMHNVAERGIASHWSYKEKNKNFDPKVINKYNWLRELVSFHQQTDDSDEFLENLKDGLIESEIYVLTPEGDVKELPEGASPIDFAFSIHTDLGLHIATARVNGKIVSIKHRLKNGDRVEILTSKNQKPSKAWLHHCVTSKAKTKVRAFVKKEQRESSLALGQEIFEKSLRRHKISVSEFKDLEKNTKHQDFLKVHGCTTLNDLYIRIGYGHITPQNLSETLKKFLKKKEISEPQSFLQKIFFPKISKKEKKHLSCTSRWP